MNNREVAHRWANQSGRNNAAKGHNFYYDGAAIWSYGSHYCAGVLLFTGPGAGVALVNSTSYSVSTSKQMGYVGSALSGRIVYVPYPDAALEGGGPKRREHGDNLKSYLDDAESARQAFAKARQGRQLINARGAAEQAAGKIAEYLELFPRAFAGLRELRAAYDKLRRELKEGGALWVSEETQKKALAANLKNRKAKEERERLQVAAEWAAKAARVAEWLTGSGDVHAPGTTPEGFALLRVKGGRVETSQGAQITEQTARALWAGLCRDADVIGLRLDHYNVTSWNGAALVVGCHRIARAELERMAAALGLPGKLPLTPDRVGMGWDETMARPDAGGV